MVKHSESKIQFSIFAEPLDILIMSGGFQWEFKHSVPKDLNGPKGPRINFTFRTIVSHRPECQLCCS